MLKMFDNIKKVLDEYEEILNNFDDNGTLTKEEEDTLVYLNVNLAKALMQNRWLDDEVVAKIVLATRGLSNEIVVKVQ